LKESKPFNEEIMGGEVSPLAAKPSASPLPPSPAALGKAGAARFALGRRERSEERPKERFPPLPRLRISPCGIFFLIVIAAAFCAGTLRQELALSLLGAVLLAAWAYCLILGAVIALINRRGARLIRIRLAPRSVVAGEAVEIIRPEGRFFRIPGILIRCRLRLETRDGRRLEHNFDPAPGKNAGAGPLVFPRRGAYYSAGDELAFPDAFGFLDFSWPLPPDGEALVLAGPRPAEEALILDPRAGGRERRGGPHYRRTDDLIDHRPYIPGDDPRRINWKLYSHGPAGSLFVREGEAEPPPHSQLLILADTEADPGLYSPRGAREAVDLLCAQVLAICLDLGGRGMDVLTGYTGGPLCGGDAAELAQALAWPAALPLPGGGKLPRPWALIRRMPEPAGYSGGFGGPGGLSGPPPELPSAGRGTCILALPRTTTGGGKDSSALDRFLSRPACDAAPCDVIFVYTAEPAPLRESAEGCARLYGSRAGVRAFAMALRPGGPEGGDS
jgi:hypothetical protein